MDGAPIRELNEGIRTFHRELLADPLGMKRVEVAITTFGPVQLDHNFTTAEEFRPPSLVAGNRTPMGEAIRFGLAQVDERKAVYRERGVPYYRPWIFLITDGAPTDEYHTAAKAVRQGEDAGAFTFFSVGVEDADMGVLAQFGSRRPVKLRGLHFRELFLWLSKSLRAVSRSRVGQNVSLPSPADWGSVQA